MSVHKREGSQPSVRMCEVEQRPEYLPGYPDWEEVLQENLKHPNIKNWAYALHDRDIDADGNLKPPHIHLVLEFNESIKFSTAGGYVGVAAQYVQYIEQQKQNGKRWVADIGGALSYLTHRNAKDKYQYDDSIVVAKSGYD